MPVGAAIGGAAVIGGAATMSAADKASQTAKDNAAANNALQSQIYGENKATLPGASKALPPRRDVWGEPITAEGGAGPDLISPIWTSTAKNDPVNAALLSSGIGMGRPSRPKGMDDRTYNALQGVAGQRSRAALGPLVASPRWRLMDDTERKGAVDTAVNRARKEAKAALVMPSDGAALRP